MPSTNNIRNNLNQILRTKKKLIKNLQELDQYSRDQLIDIHYFEKLKTHSPWLISDDIQDYSNNKSNITKNDIFPKDIIDNILDQIKNNPKQKDIILKNMLKSFMGIGDPDLTVLIENFRLLSEKELEKELLNLHKIFCEDND